MVAPPSWIPVTSAPSSIFSASNQFVLESLDVDSCRVMNAQFDLYTIMREVHCAVIVIPGGDAGAGAVTITSSLEACAAWSCTTRRPPPGSPSASSSPPGSSSPSSLSTFRWTQRTEKWSKLNIVVSEISHHIRVLALRRRRADGHHRLLHTRLPCPRLDLGTGQSRFRRQTCWHHGRMKDDDGGSYLLTLQATIPRCWLAWGIAGIWPVIFLTGLLVQAACTGRGTHHEESLPQVKCRYRPLIGQYQAYWPFSGQYN